MSTKGHSLLQPFFQRGPEHHSAEVAAFSHCEIDAAASLFWQRATRVRSGYWLSRKQCSICFTAGYCTSASWTSGSNTCALLGSCILVSPSTETQISGTDSLVFRLGRKWKLLLLWLIPMQVSITFSLTRHFFGGNTLKIRTMFRRGQRYIAR